MLPSSDDNRVTIRYWAGIPESTYKRFFGLSFDKLDSFSLASYQVSYLSLKCSSVVPSLLTISVVHPSPDPPISKRLLSGMTQEEWSSLCCFSLCSVFSQVFSDQRRHDSSDVPYIPPQISPESCVWYFLLSGNLGRLQVNSTPGWNIYTEDDDLTPPDMRNPEWNQSHLTYTTWLYHDCHLYWLLTI